MKIIAFLENIDILSNLKKIDLENAILKFYENLNHTCDLFVPKTKLNLKFNHSLPWSYYDIRNLIKEKNLHIVSIKYQIYTQIIYIFLI